MGRPLELRSDLPLEVQLGVKAIEAEFIRATRRFGKFASSHEGWAVIREEMDELWEEVRCKAEERDPDRLRKEAIQVGAMALRFLVDVVPTLPPDDMKQPPATVPGPAEPKAETVYDVPDVGMDVIRTQDLDIPGLLGVIQKALAGGAPREAGDNALSELRERFRKPVSQLARKLAAARDDDEADPVPLERSGE